MTFRFWIRICATVVIAAASSAFGTADAQQRTYSTNCPGIVAQPANWVVRVECNSSGEPLYTEYKWPFGRPDNIELVRVPWGYHDLLFGPSVGAQLTNNGHQPSLEQGYGELWFWALLPNVTKHNERTPPVKSAVQEFDLIKGMVTPVINKRYPKWDAEGWLARIAKTGIDRVSRFPGYRDVPTIRLEGRFELNRLGPERAIVDRNYDSDPFKPGSPPHLDLWFDGETPETSRSLIMCGADYLRNGQRDP